MVRRRWFDLATVISLLALLVLVVAHLPGQRTEPSDAAASANTSPDAATRAAQPVAPPSPGAAPAAEQEAEVDSGAAAGSASSIPAAGSGRLRLLPIPGSDSRAGGRTARRTIRYTVAIEGGLGVRIDDLPAAVRSTLTAARGWESVEPVHFVAVSPEQAAAGIHPDVQIVLASPDLVDRMCSPLETRGQVSCFNRGHVVLNARRWWAGAAAYGSDLRSYRVYLVNHEVGHALGHGHVGCPGRGRPAPVMLQQTLRLDGCRAYPYPR